MDLVERLRRVTLFSRLSDDYLRHVAEICQERTVPPGTRLSRQADLGAMFFVIDRGEAVIRRVNEQGIQRPVSMLHEGDAFGTTSLFLGEPRDATITAATEMHLWTIQRADFQELLAEHSEIERQLIIPAEILAKLRAPRYAWLDSGEVVILHCRRHWLVFLQSVLFISLFSLFFTSLIIGLFLFFHISSNTLLLLPPVLAICAIILAWHWFGWSHSYFAVTTHRATHHEQVAFLYESREEAPLERVQNINVARGMGGRLFGYGDLTIETAAESGRMFFDHIPAPENMREAIFAQIDRVRAMRRAVQRQLIRDELAAHMNIEISEPLPEVKPGSENPIEYSAAELEAPEIRPSRLVRAIVMLADLGFIPRTRIETPNEITWRKHWLFLIRDVALPLTLAFLLTIVTLAGFLGFPHRALAQLPLYPYVTLGFTLVMLGWFWWEATDWSNDLYIVTNERIIDVEKHPLFFSEQRREASLGMIQNASLRIPNVVAQAFDYGDVLVQTAGETGEFTFNNVPNPRDVQRVIFRRMEAYQERQREQEAARRRADLAEWFSVYDELRHLPQTDEGAPSGEKESNSEEFRI
jgi:uncharacterized membrane protein YdbT with pleckstrin-like domain